MGGKTQPKLLPTILIVTALLQPGVLPAAPVAVRYTEGLVHVCGSALWKANFLRTVT